jgi:hypothetical protein
MHNCLSILLFLLMSATMSAQWFPSVERKGDLFGGWGWNRAIYSDSDIRFKGEGYDFTLLSVHAKDRQTQFKAETYFGINTITIPQTNMRFGYFITDRISLSFGVDHMKYVMQNYQTVRIQGSIDNKDYADMIQEGTILLSPSFLTFEHTDGLNYINAEVEYHTGIWKKKIFQFNVFAGAGIGAMLPKSNVRLMGFERNDEFHLAGGGTNVKAGAELLIGKHFFLRYEGKAGFINMPDILTRNNGAADRASQHFFFGAMDGMFGFNVPLKKKTGTVSTVNNE